jgi:hypothetical protein
MAMAPRLGRLGATAVLQLGTLVLAHELVFLARYGSRFGEALVHSGHGEAWSVAATTSLTLAALLVALGTLRLGWLGLLVRRRGAEPARTSRRFGRGALVRAWLPLAVRMTVLTLVLLTIQENLEHAVSGLAVPGAGILFSDQYAGAAWITIAVALFASFVCAIFAWRHDVLLARLRASRRALPRGATSTLRPVERLASPIESILGRSSALRAPPPAKASA